jgi:S1-C subfamily serine protease
MFRVVTTLAVALLLTPGLTRAQEPGAEYQILVREAVLSAKPAVALVTTRVDAEATLDCGAGPVTVKTAPYTETGTGWFVDGRGYLITNAHVVDPAQRLPPWVTRDLGVKAIDKACVDPALAKRGLRRGERPDLEHEIHARIDMGSITLKPSRQITVLLSNGTLLPAAVKKFSPPITTDAAGHASSDSGRDLALLRVPDGNYPALALRKVPPSIETPIHIIGFPGVVIHHELLNKTASLEASVTNGTISGFKQDLIGQDIIQTDAPAAPGNSGGPAIGNHAAVAGVLTFVSLSETGEDVQGFNFLIPARDVQTFLDGTEVKPGQSRFSELWVAGLHDLDGGRLESAAPAFTEANALLPGLPDVKRAITETEYRRKNPVAVPAAARPGEAGALHGELQAIKTGLDEIRKELQLLRQQLSK